jgi:hypothetical protein
MDRKEKLKEKIANLRYDIASEADCVLCGLLEEELASTEKELKDLEERETKDKEACGIAIQNSYSRCLYGDKQLSYCFFAGMRYGETGVLPKNLLDDEEFLKNPEKFMK